MPLSILLAMLVIGYLVRKLIFIRLARLAKNTKTQIDDIIIESIKRPLIALFLILGIYFAVESSDLHENLANVINKSLMISSILLISIVLANVISKAIKIYSNKIETTLPVTSLTQHISRIIIFVIGILVILNSLGISITPILATLGIGGLAVALALQDTLSNLFAGFYIIISKQLRTGDYIKLDSGEEGYVIDITWRTTKIKMLPNNIILIPNEKLTKVIVTNYYLPDKEMAVLVNLGVHYKSDLRKVEKITCEVAKEIMKKAQGGIPEFEPFIRYHTFGDSSINFTVILRAGEFVDQYLIKHEFIKLLHERYNKEGIIIPYPIRTLHHET